jgi:NAD(P)-dependent dehydrogenase (short-subunit alcohol dehydrogenase family)
VPDASTAGDGAMRGRVCIVTGASSGIGRATARELARRGATLRLVCRDAGRGEDARREIAAAGGGSDVALFLADLAVQADVRRVARELLDRCPAIHVLVNNAGVVNLRHTETADGVETVFAVNHLAYFLLTRLLLDRLRASAPARIVVVASEAHRWGAIDFDDLGHRRRYRAMRVYGASKLANLLFTRALARRLEGTGVTVNAVHPGAVATRLGQNNGALATLLTRLLAPFFRTPERGAETPVFVATAPALAGVSGRYFANGREIRPSRAAEDDGAAERLWTVSERLTGLADDASRGVG